MDRGMLRAEEMSGKQQMQLEHLRGHRRSEGERTSGMACSDCHSSCGWHALTERCHLACWSHLCSHLYCGIDTLAAVPLGLKTKPSGS